MGEYRAFSNDGMWWWNGTDWMPTRAPDGRSAIWNGTQWVPGGGVMGVAALTVIAIGLGVGEVIWAFIVIFVLILEANAEYEARGRTGYESITDTSLSLPLLLSLLIVPVIITILGSAIIRRRWWIAFVIGGWPLIALIALAGGVGAIVTIGITFAALVGIAWLVHRRVWGSTWQLSADGQQWVRGARSVSTRSKDGRWRWDGRTWVLAGEAGVAPG